MTDDDELRARLAALPQPAMPDDVRARILRQLPADNVVPITAAHGRRLGWLVAAAAIAAVMTLVAAGGQTRPVTSDDEPAVMRAGAIYSPESFAEQLRARYLDDRIAAPRTGTFADSPTGLRECTHAVSAQGHLLGVDAGRYGRTNAVVLITRYPADRQYEEIWVVTPTCGPEDSYVIRHMLFDVDRSATTL